MIDGRRARFTHWFALIVTVWSISPTFAQSQNPSLQGVFDSAVQTVAGEITAAKAANPRATLPPGEVDLYALRGLQHGSLVHLLQDFEEQRTDEQIGASATASGSTTLVSKGAVPEVLALALENGAITRSQSGTTLTFRANLGGALDALTNKGFVQMLSGGSDPSRTLLKRVSLSASFDAARPAGSQAGPVFTGDDQQLSQWSARVQLLNRRDPMRSQYRQRWQTVTAGPQSSLGQASGAVYAALSADPAFERWLSTAREGIAAAPPSEVASALSAEMARFPADALHPSTRRALADYDRAATAFVAERQQVLDDIAMGAQVAFELINNRPPHGSHASTLRLIGAVGGSFDVTGNAALTLWDEVPVGLTRRLRDVQASVELAATLGSVATTGPFVIAFAVKYFHQPDDSFDEAGMRVPSTSGTTLVGQAKLTIPIKGTGVRIPLSVTFANRSELIQEHVMRGNVGITFDVDSVFARFKP